MDGYERITSQILDMLERGVVPWRKPWIAAQYGAPVNAASHKPYRGINRAMLGVSPYADNRWLTFKQAHDLGGYVRKGERSTTVVFWKSLDIAKRNDAGDTEQVTIPLLRFYLVWNVEQCDGLNLPKLETPTREFTAIESAERIVDGYRGKPAIVHSGTRAFYAPFWDKVTMPARETFDSAESYYSVLFHELGHSTGHTDRLKRSGIENVQPFGSDSYGQEELVAEFSAAFLCASAGIEPTTLGMSASYIDSWIRTIKADKRIAVIAAAQAQKASDWIVGERGVSQPVETPALAEVH